jgi:putative ATP-dependent endonuclease of OLD family
MSVAKTKLAKPIARAISGLKNEARRFPPGILELFDIIAKDQGLPKRPSENIEEDEEL